jgi:hypothetical protein
MLNPGEWYMARDTTRIHRAQVRLDNPLVDVTVDDLPPVVVGTLVGSPVKLKSLLPERPRVAAANRHVSRPERPKENNRPSYLSV